MVSVMKIDDVNTVVPSSLECAFRQGIRAIAHERVFIQSREKFVFV